MKKQNTAPATIGIETTLGALVDAEPALRRMAALDGLPAKTTYHVAKLARLVADETKVWYEERERLFDTMGVLRDARSSLEHQQHGPKVREIPADRVAEFKQLLKSLLDVPVSVAWGPVRSVELPNAKASDLVELGPLCELVDPEGET